ncbi:MAG: aldehyde dehydrogenase family protein [Bacteroidota bacterium]
MGVVPDNGVKERLNVVFERQRIRAIDQRSKPLTSRIKRLRDLKHWIEDNGQLIQKAIYNDFGKPPDSVDLSEIYPLLTELKDAINNLRSWARDTKVDSSIAYLSTTSSVKYEPKGVCLIIAPWNFPFLLTLGPLVSALAAGNTVILKPSEMTPNTTELIDRMIGDLYKEDLVAVFKGDSMMSQELLKLPFDHIFFTGSPQVGKIVMTAAAKNLTSVTLELGGKSPTVVDETASLNDAAQKIAWGKFMNNGQTCVAPDYVLVQEKVHDKFVEALQCKTRDLFDSEKKGFNKSSDYARIINKRHWKRLIELKDEVIQKGGQLEMGGEVNETECYLAPTILSNIPKGSGIMQEEVFGPILPVTKYNSIDEVIEKVNHEPKPLAFYYFGKSSKNRERLLRETSSGTFCVNDCVLQFGHPHLPFGGVNNSGIGKSHGKYGFLAFSNEKAVLRQRVGFTTTKLVYPPYGKRTRLILKLLKKFF